MKSTHEIKKFLKEVLGLTVKGNTSSGRSQWQTFYVPCDKGVSVHVLRYSLPEFPVEFRRLCLQTIYGNEFEIHPLACAGNVGRYSVAMVPSQWEHVMAVWPVISQTQTLKDEIARDLSVLG